MSKISVAHVKMGGYFSARCFGPDGKLKWDSEIPAHNIITTVGLNKFLDDCLTTATWYVGLKNSGTPAAGDTLASHATWTENSNYTGDRKEYVEAAASGGSITNSASKASFAIDTNSQTIVGAFLCSAATGTSGTLLCAADFASSKSADSGDTIEVTYTISAADDGS